MGRIQRGGEHLRLTADEYGRCLVELLASPTVQRRPDYAGDRQDGFADSGCVAARRLLSRLLWL